MQVVPGADVTQRVEPHGLEIPLDQEAPQAAAANLQRIDGHPDRPGLPSLDLAVQAQEFLKAVIRP